MRPIRAYHEGVRAFLIAVVLLGQALGAPAIRPGDAVVDADEAGIVSGEVLDRALGQPAADIEVRLLRPGPEADRSWPEPWVLERGATSEELARVRTSPAGRFEFRGVAPGRYRVRARDSSGTLATEDVSVAADDLRRSVTLEITRIGGIGVRLHFEDGEAPRVRSTIAGMAAAEAGLQPDDLIVSLDDRPTAGLRIREFVDLCRGPVGSTVLVGVRRGDEVRQMQLERRSFPRR